jgi:branched-chain amino acid transport system permease protein
MVTEASERPLIRHRYRPGALSLVGLSLVGVVVIYLALSFYATPANFINITIFGFTTGVIYALIALGYTLVYGILELINFAHGDVFMLGGMMAATLVGSTGFGLTSGQRGIEVWLIVIVVGIIAMAFCGTLNVTIETVAYRPLRGAPRLAPLITAIGMSFILQNVGLIWKGPNYINVVDVFPHSDVISVGGVNYSWDELIVVIITTPVFFLLLWLVEKTRQGKAMRATAQDADAAAMMGINVNRTISFTFLIAGCLAGAAGLVFALWETNIRFDQGFQLGLIAFTAAVLGGIGNLPGAVLGAILIGLIQAYNEGLSAFNLFGIHFPAPPGSDWTQSIVFAILIIILVFRPEGLLGERTPEGG